MTQSEAIEQIQYDHWSDKGKHTPSSSSCQECSNELVALLQQAELRGRIDELRRYRYGSFVKTQRIAVLEAQLETLSQKESTNE